MGLLPVWRESAVASATGGGTSDVQSAVLHQVETWFEEQKLALRTANLCFGFRAQAFRHPGSEFNFRYVLFILELSLGS